MLHRDAKAELIRRAPLFSRCSKRELRSVAAVADEVDLPEGTAEVRRKGRKVNTMRGGDFFGEIALVSGAPRTATVTATSPVRALVLTDRDFRTLLKQTPSMQLKVLEALADRLPPDRL